MASPQHRCVFVGNIPYDATEEQLIEICREVGPVVSFRLVIDRETGKPKGYGFCEYKDEETALSARRNLQGYEINGRQLRVDFAENDKGADRTREQGRGGPGMAANVDPQKQLGGPALHGEAVHHQPIGLHLAITAAAVMTGALGGPQVGMQPNQNGIQSHLASPNDPLTLHLAKMSRNQLNEIMAEMKLMATQKKEIARQLLLTKPQLLKALFQAQIMLGMVTPQVLQMPNLRQDPGRSAQPVLQDGQQQVIQLPGLPPLAQKMQFMPKVQEGQSQLHNRLSAPPQSTMHHHVLLPQHAKNQALQQTSQPLQSGIPTLPSVHPSVRPQIQPGPSTSLGIVQTVSRDADRTAGVAEYATRIHGNNVYTNIPVGVALKRSMVNDSSESISHPLKMAKTEDGGGTGTSLSLRALNASKPSGSAPSQAYGSGAVPVNQVPKVDEVQYSNKQIPQSQLPADVESTLLQQVLTLTPEQLNSLPPEQRQQVIQLQQALSRDQMQPS